MDWKPSHHKHGAINCCQPNQTRTGGTPMTPMTPIRRRFPKGNGASVSGQREAAFRHQVQRWKPDDHGQHWGSNGRDKIGHVLVKPSILAVDHCDWYPFGIDSGLIFSRV